MQCRAHVAQLGRLYQDLREAAAEIVGSWWIRSKMLENILHSSNCLFLDDPDRAIYHRNDLERAIFGIQRTASVVLDRNGVIQSIKRATNPMVWLKDRC